MEKNKVDSKKEMKKNEEGQYRIGEKKRIDGKGGEMLRTRKISIIK